jgi:hypothetical protein
MRRFLYSNGLSVFFLVLFLLALGGQAIAGHAEYNEEERAHAEVNQQQPQEISLGRYVTSSNFAQAVTENWQSEYLQFVLFILATTWLIQRGSTESKKPGEEGRESEQRQKLGGYAKDDSPGPAKRRGGIVRALYSNSLLIVMGLIWLGSWFAQSVSGWSDYNAQQLEHAQPRVDWLSYIATPQFWESTLQNWQSEFLAVGSMAIFTVYLRQRGSTQSKPVGAPHHETAAEG